MPESIAIRADFSGAFRAPALAKPAVVGQSGAMDALTLFGLFAVTFMLVCYMMEAGSPWWTFAFAIGCLMGSAYGFLQGAWPFGLVELAWTVVALNKWMKLRKGQASVA